MRTATDVARFNCTWSRFPGQWFRLDHLSAHLKHKVPEGQYRLLDDRWNVRLAPKSEVKIHSLE